MATNCGRLCAASSLAMLALAATFVAPRSASAEPPKTALEWFNLIHRRNADIYGVRMESSWQRFDNGKLVEEWDQIVETDDLGGIRIEELGRTQPGPTGDDTIAVTDTTFAFDGSEYRELTKTWVASAKEARTAARKRELRSTPAKFVFGSIESEPGGPSGLSRTQTPMRMADHWFVECLSNTMPEGLDLQVTPVDGRPGLWKVSVESDDDTYGHKCRAVVDEAKDLRVVELHMWDTGCWSVRYEMKYVQQNGRWRTAAGTHISFARPRRKGLATGETGEPPAVDREFRFNVRASSASDSSGEPVAMPDFPPKARIIDSRTDALYTVGRDLEVDAELRRLVGDRHRLSDAEPNRLTRARATLARLGYTFTWFFAGVATAFVALVVPGLVSRAGTAFGRVRGYGRGSTTVDLHSSDSRPQRRPVRFRFPWKTSKRS